jgi:diguanylate cyclase (GGDEF)-like protein
MLEAFEARLLTHGKNEAPSPGAFLLMGVNKFKEINETIGNIGADECLKILALKFSKLVPPPSVVYRYGGDEFACWIEGANEQQIESIVQSFVAAANEAITVKGWTFNLSLSAGIALFPRDAIDSKDIIHCADIALQDAKRSRQALLFYNPQYDENTQLKALLRNQVPGAIARADFSMFFQPKIDLATGAIAGVEALARWHHPTLGNIPPDVFIPLVEQGREINAFSRLMLHTAIQQAKSWQVEGKYIPIAVNLSPYNLLDNQLVEFIQRELDAADLAPELLAVELTESATMFDVNLAQRVFTELRDMGIKISIDDFGTGMSSMSYLQILPIDCVKLDRSFIENIQTDKVAHAIVSCMVSLCHTLGKTVVAEGVETEAQSKALREIGCDQAQGYLFARPLRVNDKELIDWFRAEVPAIAMDTGNRA